MSWSHCSKTPVRLTIARADPGGRRPRKGSALLFFPAAGGVPGAPFDARALHCGEAVSETAGCDKWIAQLWLRERDYEPTAPPGNTHAGALDAMGRYCESTAG